MSEPAFNPTPSALPSVSSLFQSSWRSYTKSWKLYVLLVLLPLLASLIILAITAVIIGTVLAASGGQFTAGRIALIAPPGLVAIIALIIVNVIAQIGFIKTVELNGETTIKALIKSSWPLLWKFILLSLLVGITVLFGLVLLIIPGIIFSIWFLFSTFILVTEGVSGTAAMRRSRYYARGKFFGLLGRLVLLIFIVVSISALLSAINNPIVSITVQLLASFILNPFTLIFTYKLYQGAKAISTAA